MDEHPPDPARLRPSAQGPSEATLTLLHAVQELADADDLFELGRLAVQLACLLTGAGAGVLAIRDQGRPEEFSAVMTWGAARQEPELAQALLRGVPEDTGLSAEVVVAGTPAGVLRVGRLSVPPTSRHRVALQAVASALGVRGEALRQRELGVLNARVLEAVWEIDRSLSEAVDLEVALPLLVDRTLALARAEVVALLGARPDGSLRVLASAGAAAALGELQPDVTEVLRSRTARHWSGRAEPDLTVEARPRVATSLVPLETRTEDPVALVVHRWMPPAGVRPQQVEDVISALALHASLILDRAAAVRDHELITLLQDRDRIARDLHDLVIQRLFAVGLTLQGTSRRAGSPEVVERLEGAVAELDQTIRDIRATIFQLRHRPGETSFRGDLRALVESYALTLGFAPVLHLRGPLDAVTDEDAHTQVLMVVREALSNVARHAHASSVEVVAETDGHTLTLTVVDDGVGIGETAVESGLANLRARAAERSGTVRLSRATPTGTHLHWSVPL